MTALTPFWTDDFPPPASPDTGDRLPATADVVVVGAGVTGLTAARRMAAGGLDVVVVDAGTAGGGASTVNGGMLAYGLKAGTKAMIGRYGRRLGLELWQASLDAVDLVEQICGEDDIDAQFERTGAAELGLARRDLQRFSDESEWMATELGFRTTVLGPDGIHLAVGSSRFTAAQIDEFTAGIHPARFAFGLAAAAGRAGATIAEHTEVTDLSRSRGAVVVSTRRGTVRAGRVLLATNGYTGTLEPAVRRGIVPLGSYIVTTEPLPRDVAERLIPRRRMMWTARRIINYLRLTADDRLMLGGRQNLTPDLDLAESARLLRRTVVDFFPELEEAEISHSWTGRLGATFDLLPHIGEIDGVWYALGYGGHGVALGTYLGHEAGGLLAGEIERSPFAEIAMPTRPYYRRRPWFLPAAAVMFRLLDRVGR
jgi:glycine/D-amino acid oxidase-like deaminating enzyme